MRKLLILAAVSTTSLALAPVYALASDDTEEMEQECRDMAMEEGVASEEIADYIADCVAEIRASGEGGYAEETESEETVSEETE